MSTSCELVIKPRLHDTTGCQTGVTTAAVSCIQTFNQLSNLFDNRFDKRLYRVYSRLSKQLYNLVWQSVERPVAGGCSFNVVVKPVVKRVWQLADVCLHDTAVVKLVVQPVDNRLHRVNGVLVAENLSHVCLTALRFLLHCHDFTNCFTCCSCQSWNRVNKECVWNYLFCVEWDMKL